MAKQATGAKLGESTANDVSTYMNPTCPRILYFDDFGPRTQRNLPFLVPSLFHISHDLLASYDWPAPSIGFAPFFHRCPLAIRWSTCPSVGALVHLFFKGYPLRSVGALIFPPRKTGRGSGVGLVQSINWKYISLKFLVELRRTSTNRSSSSNSSTSSHSNSGRKAFRPWYATLFSRPM
jgi:hypothetical protein